MLSRRQFMQLLASSSLAVAAHATFPIRAHGSGITHDIIIIGAGMAGLAAAQRLHSSGKRLLVLEARGRIGGRAFTESTSLGGVAFDHGCSWLHSARANPLTPLLQSLGFSTFAHKADESIMLHGKPLTKAEYASIDAYEASILTAIETAGEAKRDVAVGSLTTPSTPLETYAAARIGVLESGVELSELSAIEVHNQISAGDDNLIIGGLGAAVAVYGQHIPVALHSPVTHIEWGVNPIRVHCGANRTYHARRLIITLPIGVLAAGHVRFTPALPSTHHEAIHGFRMGLLNKIGLRFAAGTLPATKPFHETGNLSTSGELFDALLNIGTADTAMCFVGGNHAHTLEAEGKAAALSHAIESLSALYGSSVKEKLTHHVITTWGKDTRSLGAYSALKPGHNGARETLAAPIDQRIWFAGEALNATWSTQLAGAYLSGRHAAYEAFKSLT